MIYDQLIDNVSRRTASWKLSLLSQASRLTLIKSVLTASNIHLLSCISLPKQVCRKIDSRCINFFWGDTENKKHMHLINKDQLFKPISSGGLGIRKTEAINISLLAKQLHGIIMAPPDPLSPPLFKGNMLILMKRV